MATTAGIRTLDVVLTAGCNLRCTYCYQNDKKARRMNWETLRASVDLLLQSRQEDVRLLFVGGEPLLEFPLIERAVAYVEQVRRPDLTVRYDLITNGTLLREEQALFLVEHDFEVQLSFDGIPAAQDLRGKGTFDVLDHLLDQLRRDHPLFFSRKLSVSLTLVASTIPFVADSIDYFLDKEVQEIAISPAVTHQASWTAEQIDVLDRQYARIFRSCLRHYRRTGEVPLVLFRRVEEDSPHRPVGRSMCGVGRGETLAVDVDGQVHGCLMFADSYQTFPTPLLRDRLKSMRMGDLRDPAFPVRLAAYPAATRAAEIFHAKQDKYSSYGRCAECRFLSSCAVCPVSIGHQPGNTDPRRIPDFLCAYNLVSLKYRERFPRAPDKRQMLLGRGRLPQLARELLEATQPMRRGRKWRSP